MQCCHGNDQANSYFQIMSFGNMPVRIAPLCKSRKGPTVGSDFVPSEDSCALRLVKTATKRSHSSCARAMQYCRWECHHRPPVVSCRAHGPSSCRAGGPLLALGHEEKPCCCWHFLALAGAIHSCILASVRHGVQQKLPHVPNGSRKKKKKMKKRGIESGKNKDEEAQ